MEASARPQRLSLAMAGAATHFSPATSLAQVKKIERFETNILAFNFFIDHLIIENSLKIENWCLKIFKIF